MGAWSPSLCELPSIKSWAVPIPGPGQFRGTPASRPPVPCPSHGPNSTNQSPSFSLALSCPHPAESAFSRRIEGKAQNHFEETNSSSQNSSGECVPASHPVPWPLFTPTCSGRCGLQSSWCMMVLQRGWEPRTRRPGLGGTWRGLFFQGHPSGPQGHLGTMAPLFLFPMERGTPSPHSLHHQLRWPRKIRPERAIAVIFGSASQPLSFQERQRRYSRESFGLRARAPSSSLTLDQGPCKGSLPARTSPDQPPPAQDLPEVPGGVLVPPGGCLLQDCGGALERLKQSSQWPLSPGPAW